MSDKHPLKLAVVLSFSGAGGVEKMVMNLVRELAKTLDVIDLLVIRAEGPHFSNIPDNVNVISLNAKHTLTAVPELVRYLKKHQPDSVLVAKDRAGRAVLTAKRLAGAKSNVFIRLGTNLSTALKKRSALNAWLRVAPMRVIYPSVTKVIAVSEGVAEDTLALTKLPKDKVCVIRNPVVTPRFYESIEAQAPHEWLEDKSTPVVMGVGRLSTQKDFTTLIKAFAQLKKKRDARLMILGDGAKRVELETLVEARKLQSHVAFVGFQSNIANWLSRASCFVLSSLWEGSPNALTEALALGVPSVSTRCPSGPNETLAEGRYGPLVEMGNAQQMAEAIEQVLDNPHSASFLKEAVSEYHAKISAENYLKVFRGA